MNITTGEIVALLVFLVSLVVHFVFLTRWITHTFTKTDMRLLAVENKLAEVVTSCKECYLKERYGSLESDVRKIKERQLVLRSELPGRLEALEKSINSLTSEVTLLKTEIVKLSRMTER